MIGRRLPYYVKRGIGGIDANTLLMLHGENFTDESKNPITPTSTGVSIVTDGKYGKAFRFNGSSYINITKDSRFNFGTNSFTIDCWIKIDTTGTGDIVCLGGKSGAYCPPVYFCLVPGEKIRAILSTGSGVGSIFYDKTSSTIIAANTWVHLAFVRNATDVGFYINGVRDSNMNATKTENIFTTTGLNLIGYQEGQPSDHYYKGYLDELRISNVARWTSDFTPPTQPYDEG